jgi:hypothetical protein
MLLVNVSRGEGGETIKSRYGSLVYALRGSGYVAIETSEGNVTRYGR